MKNDTITVLEQKVEVVTEIEKTYTLDELIELFGGDCQSVIPGLVDLVRAKNEEISQLSGIIDFQMEEIKKLKAHLDSAGRQFD